MKKIHTDSRYAVVHDHEKYGSEVLLGTLSGQRQYSIREFLAWGIASRFMQKDGTFKTAWKEAKKRGYRTAKITLSWEGRENERTKHAE